MYLTLLTCVGSPRHRVRGQLVPLCSRVIQEVNIMEKIQCPPKDERTYSEVCHQITDEKRKKMQSPNRS